MLVDLIKELESLKVESPTKLFERLVSERLDMALKSYYSDLSSKYDYYARMIENDEIRTIKRLLK